MTAPGDYYPGGEIAYERDRAAGRLPSQQRAPQPVLVHLSVYVFREGRAESLATISVSTALYDAAAIAALDPPQEYREPRRFTWWVQARAALRDHRDAARVVVVDDAMRTATVFERSEMA